MKIALDNEEEIRHKFLLIKGLTFYFYWKMPVHAFLFLCSAWLLQHSFAIGMHVKVGFHIFSAHLDTLDVASVEAGAFGGIELSSIRSTHLRIQREGIPVDSSTWSKGGLDGEDTFRDSHSKRNLSTCANEADGSSSPDSCHTIIGDGNAIASTLTSFIVFWGTTSDRDINFRWQIWVHVS